MPSASYSVNAEYNSTLTGYFPSALYSHFQKEQENTLNTTTEKNLTPYSSLQLMKHLTAQSVTYFTFWRIGSVLLSITVRFLQMFLCEKAATIFR